MQTARRETGDRPSQRRITFTVPDAEAEELIAAAELSGRSLGSYIRARLFIAPRARPQAGPTVDVVALTRLQGEMERVGADIHELLRWVKFGRSPSAEEFRAAFADYRSIAAAI